MTPSDHRKLTKAVIPSTPGEPGKISCGGKPVVHGINELIRVKE
jgi:hypothetical protein